MKKLGIFCLLFILALSSCRDNIDNVDTTEEPYVPPIINYNPQSLAVNGSITGFVADEAGEPIANADVKVGSLTAVTDDFGHFFFTDITLDAKGTIVSVKKAGYFTGSRRFYAAENKVHRVKIEMLPKSTTGSFDAASGGVVTTQEDASVTFPPNSIKKADGTIYSGTVNVAAKWLDPSSPRTLDQMPGNLQGVNSEVEEVVLGTYGMIAVELESDAGEALNISEGNTATLSMPVPASMQADAPSEIPLWSFNEQYGIWVEEGKATLQNGTYIGEVSHFSFWNVDVPYPLITFEAVIEDDNGNPLSNYLVTISINTAVGVFTGTGYTGQDGSIAGLIPANEDLVLEIVDICGAVIYSQNIGPFADDVDLGTIEVDPSTMNLTTITGELLDCNGASVAEGVVMIQFSGQTVYEYVQGAPFEVTFSTCSSTTAVDVIGVDLSDLKQSDPVSAGTNGSFDVGEITVCDQQLENYILITVDDGTNATTVIYSPAQVFQDSTVVGGMGTSFVYLDNNNPAGAYSIFFQVEGVAAGNYDGSNYIEVFSDFTNNWAFGQGENFDTFTIDEYGDVGEPIIGSFEGTLTNWAVQPAVQVDVTGQFNIIR